MASFKPTLLTLAFIFAFIFSGIAQNKTIFTIDKEPVDVADFEYIYKKNNINNKADYSKASLQEYLDLFINFKLKVKEAEANDMDNNPAILDELQSYEDQLFESYLDKKIMDNLTAEAYKRSMEDVQIGHIFVSYDPNSPESIAESKNTLDKVYALLQKGESFEELAKVYSMDKNTRENGGVLGYFTSLQIAYKPLEDAAYNLKKGEFSTPIKTEAGYHIVKVLNNRPARGKIKIALIKRLISPYDSLQANNKFQIDSIYAELKKGADFGEMAKKLSEDNYTNFNGGELDWFGIGQYNETFENAAFDLLKDGDISMPFKTKTAWYIIKRLEKAKTPSFEDVKPIFETKIKKSNRYEVTKNTFADSLYTAWKMQIDQNVMDSFKSNVINGFETNTNLYAQSPEPKILMKGSNGYTINENQMGHSIEDNLQFSRNLYGESRFNDLYKRAFTAEMLTLYRTYLTNTNSDYGNLVKEYKEGILLFDQMEKNVWSKAIEDTTGLNNYFANNRSKFIYNERANTTIYTFSNEKKAKAFSKLAIKNKNWSDSVAIAKIQEMGLNETTDYTVESTTLEKGITPLSSTIVWAPGFSKPTLNNGKFSVYQIHFILPTRQKEFNEVKGFVVAAYQEEVEKKWIQTLKEKYPVIVNQSVLDQLIKK